MADTCVEAGAETKINSYIIYTYSEHLPHTGH